MQFTSVPVDAGTFEQRQQLRKRAEARYRQGCAEAAQLHELARNATSAAEANRLHDAGDERYKRALHDMTVGSPAMTARDLEIIGRGVRI